VYCECRLWLERGVKGGAMAEEQWTVETTADEKGRTVTVEVGVPEGRDQPLVSLEVGFPESYGRGEHEWTWLLPDEAREVARALEEAANAAEGGGRGGAS
jgi:hypothetical protein